VHRILARRAYLAPNCENPARTLAGLDDNSRIVKEGTAKPVFDLTSDLQRGAPAREYCADQGKVDRTSGADAKLAAKLRDAEDGHIQLVQRLDNVMASERPRHLRSLHELSSGSGGDRLR
jgi:hypothetical protein